MTEKYIVFAGSPIEDINYIKPYIEGSETVICADGGAALAHKLGIHPHIITGDFDSIPQDLLDHYTDRPDTKITPNQDQNNTDLDKALSLIPKDVQDIKVFGALGERMDHVFANILTLEKHTSPDRFCLIDDKHHIRLLTQNFTFKGNIGDKIGILPLRETKKLSFDGLLYPADSLAGPYQLGWLGTSNEMCKEQAQINVDSGLVLFTHYRV